MLRMHPWSLSFPSSDPGVILALADGPSDGSEVRGLGEVDGAAVCAITAEVNTGDGDGEGAVITTRC